VTWRLTGLELLDVDELATRPRRRANVSWDGGLVAAPGSEWVLVKLRALDGTRTFLGGSAGTPSFTVELSDRASAYWAVVSCLYEFEVEGDLPAPTWQDETPTGAPN
jgi:hypothetical protein